MKRPNSGDESIANGSIAIPKKTKFDNETVENPERKALEKQLSEKIRFKKKFVTKKGKLIMCLDELKSFDKTLENNDKMEWTLPQFFVQDIQRVVLFSLIGNQYRFFPRWCKILRPGYIKSVNMITINNVSELDYKVLQKKFKKFNEIFLNQKKDLNSIEFVSPNANGNNFLNEFVSVPITQSQWMKIRDENEFKQKRNEVVKQYKALFEKIKSKKNAQTGRTGVDTSDLDKIPRTSLMLNVVQMIREDYPLPFDTSSSEKVKTYVYTKEVYTPVHNASPLYSIDCEMCYNVDGEMEVVWLALANENLECIYETFVKPRRPIQNYLTNITGVREEHLADVSIDLSDVQCKIQELLPPDAILCGQSLNNDLHALKMFHPYVIDTSIIFNVSGNRDVKPSLRRLSAQFLGKLIQESTHNPTIDAKASLQLVLLKLRQGLDFGDVIINGCTNIYKDNVEASIEKMCLENTDLSNTASISKFIYQTGLNIDQNFFKVLLDNSVSNFYIDRDLKNKNIPSNLNAFKADTNEQAFEKLNQVLNQTKFTWTQFYVNTNPESEIKNQIDKKELKKVLNNVKEIYDKLDDDSMLIVALTGRNESSNLTNFMTSTNDDLNLNDLSRGRCFLTLKNLEIDKMEKEIKELYDTVYPGGKKDTLGVVLPEEDE